VDRAWKLACVIFLQLLTILDLGEAGVDAKTAATCAMSHIVDLYGDNKIQDPLLEEVERLEHNNNWLVTMSFARPGEVASLQATLTGAPPPRHYKAIEVDDETGEMRALRSRDD